MQADIYDSIRPAQKTKSLKEFQPYSGISLREFFVRIIILLKMIHCVNMDIDMNM